MLNYLVKKGEYKTGKLEITDLLQKHHFQTPDAAPPKQSTSIFNVLKFFLQMILKSVVNPKHWIGNVAHEILGKFASLEYTCLIFSGGLHRKMMS